MTHPTAMAYRLAAEQVYALGKILENGALTEVDGKTYLIAPISPMTADFLKATRLPDFSNALETSPAADHLVARWRGERETTENGITLRELCERYAKEKKSKIADKSLENTRRVVEHIYDVLGPSRRIKTITHDDLERVRDRLEKMPVHYPRLFPGMTMEQAVEKAAREQLRLLKPTYVRVCLAKVMSIFSWAERKWLIDRNPALGIQIKFNRFSAEFKRRPFSIDQLNKIFHAPIYTGCIDDSRNYARPGPNVPRDERFWLPLIGLFSGLRANEMCQMLVSDMETIDGILCFHITPTSPLGRDDKHLKSKPSQRHVPVHPELLGCGFSDYIERVKRSRHARLFPETAARSTDMSSRGLSSWFNQRFLKQVGAYESHTTFHSFRHNFRDALRRGGASIFVIKELCGWSLRRSAYAYEFQYGSAISIPELAEAIAKVKYPGLDLTHLYVDETDVPVQKDEEGARSSPD